MGKFVIVLLLIAAAVYVLVRVIERRGVSRPGSGPPRSAPPPRGPIGPDDDPEFLWGLNKKRRHPEDDPPPPSS